MPNKTYQQVREILTDICRVYETAARCCARAADTPNERLRLLADFLRSGEQRLRNYVESAADSGQADILDTWVQFVPTGGVEKALRALQASSDQKSAETTVQKCLELQAEIVALLRHLSETMQVPEVSELIQRLAEREERAVHQWGVTAAMKQDM